MTTYIIRDGVPVPVYGGDPTTPTHILIPLADLPMQSTDPRSQAAVDAALPDICPHDNYRHGPDKRNCGYCGHLIGTPYRDSDTRWAGWQSVDLGNITLHSMTVHPLTVPDPSAPMEGKVNTGSPETAQEAARSRRNMIAWGNDRTEVLAVLDAQRHRAAHVLFPDMVQANQHGLNAARVAEQVGKSRNQCAARLLELREMGLVEYRMADGKVITAPTDHPPSTSRGRVHFITEAGIAALRKVAPDVRSDGR